MGEVYFRNIQGGELASRAWDSSIAMEMKVCLQVVNFEAEFWRFESSW